MDNRQSVIILQELIANLFKMLRAERNIFFKDFSLTPNQYDVLQHLYKDNLTLSELSDILFLDASTLVGVVDRLEKKDWVKRKVSPQDRRKNILVITDKGKEMFESIPQHVSKALLSVLDEFSEEEIDQLQHMINKIAGSVEMTTSTGAPEPAKE